MSVELKKVGEVAIVTLNRPESLNALSFSILDELSAIFDEAANSGARALIVTGAGEKAFCAGADIKELGGRSRMAQKRGAVKGQDVFAKLSKMPIPTVALVNGYAFGGGMEMALACNFRLATPNAKFGLPEIKLGLIPGYGGTQRLPRLVGEGRALEMIMTGRTVKADEAERMGLVNRIIESDALEAALAFAAEFTGFSLPVLEFAREAVTRALDLSVQEGLKVEADLSTLAFSLNDADEGMAAFVENVNRSSKMPENQFIVTGASKGIGSSIAKELDRRGLSVVCVSRSGETSVGRGYTCDMTNEAAVREMIEAVAKEGSIAGLVNNAGLHITSPSASLQTAEYESIMRLNATAIMVASREAYPHLKFHGAGKIINIGSFFDKLGVVDNLAYCASKAAVGAITRCLAVEWAADNISVMNIGPGYIETDLNKDFLARDKIRKWLNQRIPVGRVGKAEEVARLIGALITEDMPFLTGDTIYMDGGQGMYH